MHHSWINVFIKKKQLTDPNHTNDVHVNVAIDPDAILAQKLNWNSITMHSCVLAVLANYYYSIHFLTRTIHYVIGNGMDDIIQHPLNPPPHNTSSQHDSYFKVARVLTTEWSVIIKRY